MSVCPFELDCSHPISAGFAHCCARAASGDAAAPPISDELAPPQLMAVAFWVPYQPTELQDTELAGIS
jgi:hypothetical protein